MSRLIHRSVRPLDNFVCIFEFNTSIPLADWVRHEHPEGALYFRHIEERIFTDVDLQDPVNLRRLTVCKEQILRRPQADWVLKSGNADLVLDLLECNAVHFKCSYYFVDHTERLVFWIDDFRMSKLKCWRAVPGITSATHVRLGLETEYWYYDWPVLRLRTLIGPRRHIDYFPSALSSSRAVLKELRNHIMFGITDTMTSPTSTAPVPTEYLFQMLALVNALATDIESDPVDVIDRATAVIVDKAWGVAIGRFMYEFALTRFYHFHGEPAARLDSENSVYGSVPEASVPFILVSLFLFNAPRAHLTNIQTMWMDGLTNRMGWTRFIRHLRSEWRATVLAGTLILNTNMGFLAVSSGPAGVTLNPPVQTLLSYASTLFGLGSIMAGMFLSSKYGEESRDTGFLNYDAGRVAARRSLAGSQSLAMLYSLPYTFMLWGLITFLLAFFALAVQSTTGGNRYLVVAIFIVICISALGHFFLRK
ncbi:hypothetical protein DFH06DRAFT_1429353 [Mycena polygramma]|nr:hypothetical protein DFH06DRAFT_1429353 [Mycena polygramma]